MIKPTHTPLPFHKGTTTPVTTTPVTTTPVTTTPSSQSTPTTVTKGGSHSKKHRGGGNCSGSANQWQLQNVGTLDQQLSRTFDPNLGNTATQSTNAISTILNPNASNNWTYPSNNLKGGKKRGGNLGAIAYEALTPGILLASQNMYKLKRNRTGKKTSKNKKRRTRGGDFGSLLGQAAVPGILLATQNMYKLKRNKTGKKTSKNQKRRTRGGDFGSLVGQAAVPGILLATQNMYRIKSKKNRSKKLRR
jgi:hypothetical protein